MNHTLNDLVPQPAAPAGDSKDSAPLGEVRPGSALAKVPRALTDIRFLFSLVLLLLVSPFLDELNYGRLIEAIVLGCVFLSAVLVVSDRRQVFAAVAIALVPILADVWLHWRTVDFFQNPSFMATTGLVFVGFAVFKLLYRVMTAREVDSGVLSAAIAIYLCLGLLWSFGFTLVAHSGTNAFTFAQGSGSDQSMRGFNSLYFSFCTLTTVGCSDIVAVSKVARLLVMTESISGGFYMTILIARLVSLYSSRPTSK